MRKETREAMNMLFSAKWNIPQAGAHSSLTNKEVKIIFSEFCKLNPPTYSRETEEQLHLW